ncbi:MAG TPA: DUF262 domain-containing protein [Pyrinomonadaceae bacterium]|nr:DUF262 domain-containing protein [Pyrinomonadaceae bacterium]
MIGNPLKIKDIISEMSQSSIRIPEIQRNYVWKRSQIAKLLDSIYRGFPTGSILLWDTIQDVTFKDMKTNLGRGVRPDFIPKIVLDGQQRLTSLGRVFDRTTAKQDRIIFNVMNEVFEPYSPRNFSDPRWIDVTQLLTEELSELDVLERLEDAGVIDGKDRERKREIHRRLKKLAAMREYQYPVEIVREDDLEVVTEVFIRVNSGGTRLREAELALARLAWKLPGSIVGPFEQMEDMCEDRGFELDARFLMRSLISTATRQSRFRDLKAFWERPAGEIERAWKTTEKGLRLALDFVEGNIGIPGTEFLPSQFSLVPVVVIFSRREHLSGTEEKDLRRWFLLANSFSRYAGPSETILNQDLAMLGSDCENISGLLDQLLRDQRGEPKVRSQDLERAGTSSPFFPLSYLGAIRRNATDWFKGIKIRRDSFAEDQNIEYHHIFPKKHLNARSVDRYTRDEMANLAFLGQKANRRILAREPADYLAEIAEHDPARLEAQFVPMDRSLWELDRYEDFLAARRQLLADAMNEVLEN